MFGSIKEINTLREALKTCTKYLDKIKDIMKISSRTEAKGKKLPMPVIRKSRAEVNVTVHS